jgi:hypothetical protein
MSLAGPLRRLKAGPRELEFERIISTVQAQIEPPPPIGVPKSAAEGSALADLEATACTSPLAAVLEAYPVLSANYMIWCKRLATQEQAKE